jgi:hypothetical protein
MSNIPMCSEVNEKYGVSTPRIKKYDDAIANSIVTAAAKGWMDTRQHVPEDLADHFKTVLTDRGYTVVLKREGDRRIVTLLIERK